MEYVTAKQAAELWDRSPTIIRDFCRRGMIPGAYKNERGWWRLLPPKIQNTLILPCRGTDSSPYRGLCIK